MKLYTIGFTETSAQSFFERLKKADVCRLIDTRLNNVSQLAGFAKRDDLKYFAKTILNIEYQHATELAPTSSMLDAYRKKEIDWATYESQYRSLIAGRRVEESLRLDAFDGACLLCSEARPHKCHRRLAAEYLKEKWSDVQIVHL